MSAKQLQSRYALACRYHPDEDHTDLKRELKTTQLAEHIEHVVSEWPPLTPEQRDRLAVLLRPADLESAARPVLRPTVTEPGCGGANA